ncbi:MAG: hypothetical protein GXY74_02205 [Phycisphaerae bacterium]|nr:hypothetical protein [Phycisphaerae bacterium]
MIRRVMMALTVAIVASPAAWAGDIGFEEDFALARDRAEALKQLIPGTEEYYYYHCLHYQNTGQLDKVEPMLQQWIERYKYTPLVEQIRNRQALLAYEKDPAKALEFIRERLNVQFNHQRERMDRKSDLPTSLDSAKIGREQLEKRARDRYSDLQGFEDAALEWLAASSLNDTERRDLLGRLTRPDYANLPQLIADDLKYKGSGGFGSMEIHKRLLLPQLEELVRLDGSLLNNTQFVSVTMTKLLPSDDVDWRHDAKERQAYLDRQWDFVRRLNPAHNSLKACVLYHRLVHDRALGVYDRDRFMEYVKLPRMIHYMRPEWLNREENRRYQANLGADFGDYAAWPVIGTDEPLVRDYLMHFFKEADSVKPFDEYIRDDYLKKLFAETKIVNGLGDQEQWYAMLTPGEYQALKDRIDLDFAPTNKDVFAADEPVALDLFVKNVEKLIVRVFEINAANYYRTHGKEVDTDINLDGLVPNEEQVIAYEEPPLRRVARHFDFPTLARRGVFVVDFIGNGRSSRALIRKGQLRLVTHTSAAGQVLTVLDEKNEFVKDATAWIAGHEYKPQEDGTIVVPFSTEPGEQDVVLMRGDVASLQQFSHEGEQYGLMAGIHVDREALLSGQKAQVVIRPVLDLNDEPISLKFLEEVTLVITSTDLDGVSSTMIVNDFKLPEDREAMHEFRVPERLAQIDFTLRAKVKNVSRNKKDDVQAAASFSLNGIDRTERVEDLHLGLIDGKYVLDVLGKTGEAKADRPVQLTLKHRDFRDQVPASLQTDDRGRIQLGALKDIDRLTVQGPEGTSHTWTLARDWHSYPRVVCGTAGSTLVLPWMESDGVTRDTVSLLEKRGETFVADRFEALSAADGMLQIKGLPAGDYDLLLKAAARHIAIRLAEGDVKAGYAMSASRMVQVRNEKPLQIVSVASDNEAVRIKLANSGPLARVHVVATRYVPEYELSNLNVWQPGLSFVRPAAPESVYVEGRNIGDEYRYILERRYAAKFPGNMLSRPGLLLNPWAVRKTETGREGITGTTGFGTGRGTGGTSSFFGVGGLAKRDQEQGFTSLEFLAGPSVVLWNAAPDANGEVVVPRAALGDRQHVHVLAVDPQNTAYRQVSLAETAPELRNLRLLTGLDPARHFTEQKQISVLAQGQAFTIADVMTGKFEVFDSLDKVYRLYSVLNRNDHLTEFAFILNWPKLSAEEKQKQYSKYACHELNFFLFKKDPEFFRQAVQPYLRNKKEKTFMDHWLTEADLSAYLEPWHFERLNIVERSLLAQRIEGQLPVIERHVKELYDLIPPDIERFNHLFTTALQGSSLEAADRLGVAALKQNLGEVEQLAARLDGVRARGAAKPAAPPATAAPAGEPSPAEGVDAAWAGRVREMDAKKEAAEKAKAQAGAAVRRKGDAADKNGEGLYGYPETKQLRDRARALYRRLDKTEEWAENNYYHLPIGDQTAALVTANAFWNDYAAHGGKPGFLSRHVAEASRNFTEMMLAMAVLDLPFEAAEHKTSHEGAAMTLTPGSAAVAFHKEIKEAREAAEKLPVLVSQNFFRQSDRYRHVDNEQIEKYVTDEFLAQVVYGCHVVITNPTSSRQKLDALLQVPHGAIPVLGGQYTRSVHVSLEPYRTETLDYCFYFPTAGQYAHYPVHVSRNEELVASTAAVTLNVVDKLSNIDRTSWDYVSQWGSEDEVIEYLKTNNLNRTATARIAWRMADKAFFEKVLALLDARHDYDHVLWSYGLKHNVTAAARQYLEHCDGFVNQCGDYIDTPLLTIDPVIRRSYEHLEYSPLVNARAHRLGQRWTLVNNRLDEQYKHLMRVLAFRPELDDADLMSVTYYLLLQDRTEEALAFHGRVNAEKLATRLQYDYMRAYADFFTLDHKVARGVAEKYAEYPVERWRKLFQAVLAQLDEIDGKAAKVVDDEDRTQSQTRLAETEPGFDFTVEARKITLNYQNLDRVTVNYYLMDIELLFSRQPFVQQVSGQFSTIRPNHTETVTLAADAKTKVFDLPKQFHNSNVLVEITGGGVAKSQAYCANSLALQVIENYGQLKVAHAESGKALPAVYVKVYAKMKDGQVQFYKDGYTDLRGRFDYSSLSTNELDNVERFSLLVLSESDGVTIREAAPPKR